jgi:hypothetical protein
MSPRSFGRNVLNALLLTLGALTALLAAQGQHGTLGSRAPTAKAASGPPVVDYVEPPS